MSSDHLEFHTWHWHINWNPVLVTLHENESYLAVKKRSLCRKWPYTYSKITWWIFDVMGIFFFHWFLGPLLIDHKHFAKSISVSGLDPIENLWFDLKKAVHTSRSISTIWKDSVWRKGLSSLPTCNLIKSVQKRLTVVILKYWKQGGPIILNILNKKTMLILGKQNLFLWTIVLVYNYRIYKIFWAHIVQYFYTLILLISIKGFNIYEHNCTSPPNPSMVDWFSLSSLGLFIIPECGYVWNLMLTNIDSCKL